MDKKIVITGAGIGSLATAVRLSYAGFNVSLFEKNSLPGGKMGEIREKGYRFDTGPSLFTLPELVDNLPGKNGTKLKYSRLEHISRYFYPDGISFTASGDPDKFIETVAESTGNPANEIREYLSSARSLYELSSPVFIFSAFHRWKKLFTEKNLGLLTGMMKFNPFSSMHRFNTKALSSPKVIQLFDRYATYNGSNPYFAPATLNIIAHLEHNLGAYFPEGGMRQLVDHLWSMAVDNGVKFRFNCEVKEIIVDKSRATGIVYTDHGNTGEMDSDRAEPGGDRGEKVTDKIEHADIVISGGDIFRTWKELLPGIRSPRSIRKPDLSSSAIIFYWGVKKEFKYLNLHNIFFSADYKGEFISLSGRGPTIFNDPTIYIYNSSFMEKSDAPKGCSNLFVMINSRYNKGENWEEQAGEARRIILTRLRERYDLDIEPYIEFEQFATPETIEKTTLSTAGALYGNSSNSITSAFNRHPNFSNKIENLFFTGGSVHPGGGIPLCLASAMIVENEVNEYVNKRLREKR